MGELALPSTVNLHIVGHCNFKCRYCYARFVEAKEFLPLTDAQQIIDGLPTRGVRRVTFAGGEPTLHPQLLSMLRHSTQRGLITSLVTNGSFDRDYARRLFPWLRWLVLSVDSHLQQTNDLLGRRRKGADTRGQPSRVEQLAGWVHEWNRHRPQSEHVCLKLNIVVNALNAAEDPSKWIATLRPSRIKLLQCTVIPGENDDAADLEISPEAFQKYAARLKRLGALGVTVVAEASDVLLDSYAMVDPKGRFRQSHGGRYAESEPIAAIGIDKAWSQVGGCSIERFHERGGDYDAGMPAEGARHQVVAIEGLDGSGKSTLARELATRLGSALITNPPLSMRRARTEADESSESTRRDWYRRANATAMEAATDHIFRACSVVMDRSYASTWAYEAAELGRIVAPRDIPTRLARPDLLVLLNVREETRIERLQRRDGDGTTEEQRLRSDGEFRERVLAGYRALGATVIDAEQTPEKIIADIVALMKHPAPL